MCFIVLVHNQMRTYTNWAPYGQTISFISYHNVWKSVFFINNQQQEFPNSVFSLSIFISFLSRHRL